MSNTTTGRPRSIICFPDKYVCGWPRTLEIDPRAAILPIGDCLLHRWKTDGHFVAYAADVARRLTVDLFRAERHAEKIALLNPRMIVAVFDIDGPAHATTGAFADAEWAEALPRIRKLLTAHPGGFVYRTRGGFRIVYALPVSFPLLSAADEARWTALYLSWCRYLQSHFDIVADPKCADWTRHYRAPFVVRDGVSQDLEIIGDPHALGRWAPKLTREDRVMPKRVQAADHGTCEAVPLGDLSGPYARLRVARAARYLATAPLSIKGRGGRTTMFGVCLALVRRMRLPLDVAAELIDVIYNRRLAAAGTSTWSRDTPGPHGGCIMERLEKARDTGTVPIGDVPSEDAWHAQNRGRA